APSLSGGPFHSHVLQQGLRRCSEPFGPARTAHPLGLRRRGFPGRNLRELCHRSIVTLGLWSVESGGGHHGAGIRTLLSNADLLLARRLFDWAEPCRCRAAWIPELSH